MHVKCHVHFIALKPGFSSMFIQNELTRLLNIRFPLVMAPMFLVSNEVMVKEAIDAGIMGCFPSLNFRSEEDLRRVLKNLEQKMQSQNGKPGTYAVNLIVQKTNPLFEKHLKICVDNKVPVYITSLGNPRPTIDAAHSYGAKVFCDVTNITHAKKSFDNGCDGFIAVGQGAGGHAGPYPLILLVEALKKEFPDKPILAAGGIANGSAVFSVIASGASAAYIGTRFIASNEANVPMDYKQAIVESGMDDIVMTDRISGTPCSIINTAYAKKIGLHQNKVERYLSKNPRTKKYFKMLVNVRGMKWLEDAVKPGTHHNLWCAGQSVEMIHDIKPVKKIIEDIITEFDETSRSFNKMIS
jgi:nitronate monooxygenase